MLLKDSSGNRSFTHTIAVVAFIVVMTKVLLGGNSLVFGSFSFSIGTIDSFSIAAILGPTLGAYIARRYGQQTDGEPPDDPGSGAKAGKE